MAVDQARIGEDLVKYFKHIGFNDRDIQKFILQPATGIERLNIIDYEFYEEFIFPINGVQRSLNGSIIQELGEYFYDENKRIARQTYLYYRF